MSDENDQNINGTVNNPMTATTYDGRVVGVDFAVPGSEVTVETTVGPAHEAYIPVDVTKEYFESPNQPLQRITGVSVRELVGTGYAIRLRDRWAYESMEGPEFGSRSCRHIFDSKEEANDWLDTNVYDDEIDEAKVIPVRFYRTKKA